jgi:hypothetical protein
MTATRDDRDQGWRLRPVIELEPARFGEVHWPHPSTVEQDRCYWKTCLAQAGITELEAVAPGSWHVLAEAIDEHATLAKILRAHFRAEEIPADPLDVNPLSGGFALVRHGEVVVLPSCCCDLANLEDWEQAAAYEGAEPTMLWIGHPWLSVRSEEDRLCMREVHEPARPEPARAFALPRAALHAAIARARPEIDALYERLLPALEALTPPGDARALAARLVGR